MLVDLDRESLIHLAKGVEPYYSVMDHPLVKANGSYTGGHLDRWDWSWRAFENLSDEEILEVYNLCRNSWKK